MSNFIEDTFSVNASIASMASAMPVASNVKV